MNPETTLTTVPTTPTAPITDAAVEGLAKQGYVEGSNVPGLGTLLPDGTFKAAPTVISSAPAEKKVAADTATLAQAETQMQGTSAVSAPNRVFRVGSALYNADTNKPLTAGEANAVIAKAGGDLNRIAPGELPATPVDEAISGVDGTTAAPAPVKTAAELALESSMVQMAQLKETMDATSKAYINSIEREYDTIIKQQELANKAFEGGIGVEGIRSGRARYAPVMQYSILNEAVSAGIGKIAALNAKKQSLIIQAQQARDENNFKFLSKTIDTYRETIKEERQAAKDAAEAVYKAAEEARAQAKADRESIEALSKQYAPSIVASGDESPETIMARAESIGIPATSLYNAIEEYKKNAELDARRYQPAIVNEYNLAREQGYTGTFLQYYQTRQAIGRAPKSSSFIDTREAVKIGVPSLAGLSEDEIVYDLGFNTVPPQWFIDHVESNARQSLIPDKVAELWTEFKSKPEIQEFVSGDESNLFGIVGLGSSLAEKFAVPDNEE